MPHPFGSCRLLRLCVCTVLMILAAVVLITPSAYGQLTDEDIKALQERAIAEGWTFTVGANPATQYPLEDITGLVVPDNWKATAKFDPCTPSKELPATFDWREITGCPPIRNQGGCGSCWAFATTGALECAIRIKDGEDVDLSEQWLVSCNQSSWDCGGGWFAHDYHQFQDDKCGDSGAVMEEHFPYTASDEYCDCPYPHTYYLDSWSFVGDDYDVPSNDAMKQAIMDHGPISIAFYVNSAFQAYNGGVFTACGVGTVNHAVVLVGWDDTQGLEGVWFLRNSWGPNWGEDGYIRIKYNCVDFGTGACYVNYHRAQKIAIIGDELLDITGGDGDSIPEAGETVQMVVSFENRFVNEVTDVTANLFFDDASINVTQGTAFLGNILPDDTAANTGAPFEFEIPADYIPRIDSMFVEFIWDGGAQIDTQVVDKIIGGVPILVIDDDNDDNIEKYYTGYLDDLRVPYDIAGASSPLKSGIPNMSDYPIAFWIIGDYRPDPISRLSIQTMSNYLDGGGNLFLTGQRVASQLSTYDPEFLSNFLKSELLSSTYLPILVGQPGGQVFPVDDSIVIIGSGGADNQDILDQVAAVNGGVPELAYMNNPGLGAVSYVGDYKLLFFTFGFEAIVNGHYRWTPRDTIFDRIINFFNLQTPPTSPAVYNTTVSPGDPTHMISHTPTFSWDYSDPASQPQVLCQAQITDDKFWQFPLVWDSGPISASETEAVYDGSSLVDGMYYYVRVRASNGSLWSEWSYGEMHMNSVPIPTGLTPNNMEGINGDHPQLSHDTPDDEEGDSLTFSYELYEDSLMTVLLIGEKNSGKAGTAAWQVPMVLTPEEDYYWRVRSSDGYEDGEWSELASFWVTSYVLGDANGDESINVGDAVYIINYVFKGGPAPDPVEAGDANCDGNCNVGDAVYLINYVFKGGPEPGCQ